MIHTGRLLPWLKDTERPGTKIGRMLKACQEAQSSRSKLRPVKSLPKDSTAQGIRRGCVNQLAATMPGEFAVAATGHDLTHTSAFYEYMNPTVAMMQPAANVLSNWSPPPFGQLGHGPKAPTLDCLSESDRENVKKMIEIMWLNERFPHYMTRSGIWSFVADDGSGDGCAHHVL